ncbi:hypothetical protein KAJ83_08600 [Marivibrio halodurans]|uniref:Uncharacterized protein n=1 Tax=Marivibrio halodurans TaxID=2039722 RepID=A0A8J7V2D7_9PROT|nr:hypothetical protein [Marivibrio halodurans]MBP5857066.1 hypothetical protein [Marivibrio halodurans]
MTGTNKAGISGSRWRALSVGLVFLALGACAGDGRLDNPFDRRATWFDHISGGDIARGCRAGTVPAGTYRFTEFRNRAEQVRLYDLSSVPSPQASDGISAHLSVHVLEGPIRIGGWPVLEDPLRPWQGVGAETGIPAERAAAITRDARAGGLEEPAPEGRILASRSYFWLVAACLEGGRFAFQVWEWPDAAYKDRAFAEILHALDPTGIPLNTPPVGETRLTNSIVPRVQAAQTGYSRYTHYDLIVEPDGVRTGRSYAPRL